MPFINGGHIWLILALIVLLVIFGPGKLPELGTAIGKTIKAFKNSTEDLRAGMSHKDPEPAPESARIKPVEANPPYDGPMSSEPRQTEPVRGDTVESRS